MRNPPRILDLYCGAGGAGMGYSRAGFEVGGVDIKPQPRYAFPFYQGDALEVLREGACWPNGTFYGLEDIDAIHASPPCQAHSSLRHFQSAGSLDLIAKTRELLRQTGLPYVIENVMGAPLIDPVKLCGSSLGLGAMCEDGTWRQLRRHRLFESNFPLMGPPCSHRGEPIGVYGTGSNQNTVANGGTQRGYKARRSEANEALGIDWMFKRELADAIPPVYTEYLGLQLMAVLERATPMERR